ncbi:MAG: hypothetical protein HOP12_02010 [Candidatus Eisenbacteria bacterium]|uniref:Porin n=1 Tax=Eiseniibacteriota bacterium TaxID=2212470 RepID=A0A849SM11_UNCEI|nr:hypothetical protein [Candidatus Eisenbacteria bacterium]
MSASRLAFAIAACVALAGVPGAGRASTEEFASFSATAQEEDDESLLDHALTAPPSFWRDEWERGPRAFRTSQGCLTSGQWILVTQLKLEAPLGDRARFGLEYLDDASDRGQWEHFDLWFRFPTRVGRLSAMFRPFFDKSRQDFAVQWETGADTAGLHLQLTFGVEDMFNNLWAFRQTRVGNLSEPYETHPYEPAARVEWRGEHSRFELGGRWLTVGEKQLIADPAVPTFRLGTLWGADAWGYAETRALATDAWVTARSKQVFSRFDHSKRPDSTGNDWRRQWSLELGARRALGARWTLEARGIYQSREQETSTPLVPGRFEGLDRLLQLELGWRPVANFGTRFGGLHDRIGVTQSYPDPLNQYGSYGTRTENRLYVGVWIRLGRVLLSGVEGIELDDEPYDVSLIHDKGFVSLQTTF